MSLVTSFLALPSVVVIGVVALLVSLFSMFTWKLVTDQKKMKSIQDQQKKMREDMKKYKDNPDKMMKMQKKSMELSMEILPQTMKIMLITLIPIFMVFNWLGSTVAYAQLMPGQEFTSTVKFESVAPGDITLKVSEGLELLDNSVQVIEGQSVSWTLTGKEGSHELNYQYGNEEYKLNILVGEGNNNPKLEKQRKLFFIIPMGDGIGSDSNIKEISVDLQQTRPLGKFNAFGYYPGWFAIYFVFSLVFSTVLRKALKIY